MMARQYLETEGASRLIHGDLNKRLEAQPNLKEIEDCSRASTDAAEAGGDLKMSSCYLKTARSGLEAMFKHLAVCEVFVRAQLSYENYLDHFFSRSAADLRQDQIKKKCTDVGKEDKINQCYRQVYLDVVRDGIAPRLEGIMARWPASGECRLK